MYICTLMNYFLEEHSNCGAVYSCDKIVMKFKIKNADELKRFFHHLNYDITYLFQHWSSRKFATYREQFKFEDENETFWLGVGHNGVSAASLKACKLEFNPNKVAELKSFKKVLQFVRRFGTNSIELDRWDFAADFLCPRSSMELMKDGRLYEEMKKSNENRTQYLGERNKSGRTKLYNKQLESNLPLPMTRLEITLSENDSEPHRARALFPCVYKLTEEFSEQSELNDTDNFILKTLCAEPQRLRELGRRKRELLAPFLQRFQTPITFDEVAFNSLYMRMNLHFFGNLPQISVENEKITAAEAAAIKDVYEQLSWNKVVKFKRSDFEYHAERADEQKRTDDFSANGAL